MNIEYVKTEAVQLYDSHREWYAVYDSHDNTVIALCFDEEDARRIVETYTSCSYGVRAVRIAP